MPEALTESFCERCGTRYEFKAPTRLNSLRRTRGLVTGLRNYILSQDSLGDSVGDALRSEEERLASQQLEAFHEAFNFCIDCRQYTCVSCWNEDAGRCRTCIPVPGRDDLIERLEAAFESGAPGVTAQTAVAEPPAPQPGQAWPAAEWIDAGWPASDSGNGHVPPEAEAEAEPEAEPVAAFEVEAEPEAEPEPVALFEAEPAPEPVAVLFQAEPEPEPVAAFQAEPEVEPEPVVAWEDDGTFVLLAEPEPEAPAAEEIAPITFAEAPQLSTDEAAAALQAEPEPDELIGAEPLLPKMAEAAPPALFAELELEPEPEPVAAFEAEPEVEPEPVVGFQPEPEVEPEPVVAFERHPEPIAEIEAEPEPAAASAPDTLPGQVAPSEVDIRLAAISEPVPGEAPETSVEAEPETVPDTPELAARRAQLDQLGLDDVGQGPVPIGQRRALPYRSAGAPAPRPRVAAAATAGLWAASSREVAEAVAQVGVQSCAGCGLSLSASARFCRRCGTRQAKSA